MVRVQIKISDQDKMPRTRRRGSATARRGRGAATATAKRGGAGLPYVRVLRYVPPAERAGRGASRPRPRVAYVEARARRMGGLSVDAALQNMYADARGRLVRYRPHDLAYDVKGGLLREVRRFDVHNAGWLTEHTAFDPERGRGRGRRRRRLLSTCAPPAYVRRHPLSALAPCGPPHRRTCRHQGRGRGSHCVDRFGTAKKSAHKSAHKSAQRQRQRDAADLSAYVCAFGAFGGRTGLP